MLASGFDRFPPSASGGRHCGAGMLLLSHDHETAYLGLDYNMTYADVGGRADPGDASPAHAAVREAREELLGVLDPVLGSVHALSALVVREVIVPSYYLFVVALPPNYDVAGAFARRAAEYTKRGGRLEVTDVRAFAFRDLRNAVAARCKSCRDLSGKERRLRDRTIRLLEALHRSP
mmetsp:Transcript_18464/g.57278  ORF Transcript_18464/g.57278 Transcript_18464/m.57278 type:complete len:177 (-) Transcript_18464:73-603(-)